MQHQSQQCKQGTKSSQTPLIFIFFFLAALRPTLLLPFLYLHTSIHQSANHPQKIHAKSKSARAHSTPTLHSSHSAIAPCATLSFLPLASILPIPECSAVRMSIVFPSISSRCMRTSMTSSAEVVFLLFFSLTPSLAWAFGFGLHELAEAATGLAW